MVEFIDLPLFQSIYFIDVGLHDSCHTGVVETMQTVTGDGRKTPPNFVYPSGTRVKATNTISDSPFYRRVIAGIKMK